MAQVETKAVVALAVELPSEGGVGAADVELLPDQPGKIGLAVDLPFEKAVQEVPTVVSSVQQWGIVDEGDGGKNNEVRSFNGKETVGLAVELPSKEARQEVPTVVSSLQQRGIMDEDDERRKNEGRSVNGGEIVEITKASKKDLKVTGPASPRDSLGEKHKMVKGSASLSKDDGGLDNGARRVETRTADSKNEAVGALALSPSGTGSEDEAERKEGRQDKEKTEAGKGEEGSEEGQGGEQAQNGSAEMSEGVAASSTPSTVDMTQEKRVKDWAGNGFLEAPRGVGAINSSTTSTSTAIREGEEKEEERLGNEKMEMFRGIAASLTPSTTNGILDEETNKTGVKAGHVNTLEGGAASSTPSTRDATQEQKIKEGEGEGTGNVEVVKRVTSGSAPSTGGNIQEHQKEGEEGVGGGNVEMLGGAAASSTPSTGDVTYGEQKDAAAKDRADGYVDGAAGHVAVTGAVLSGKGGEARLDLAMDMKDLTMDVHTENGEVAPAVREETPEEEEGKRGMGQTEETDLEGAAMGDISNESTLGVGEFPKGAVQGSMECANTKEGEGVENIVNIATWKDVPG